MINTIVGGFSEPYNDQIVDFSSERIDKNNRMIKI